MRVAHASLMMAVGLALLAPASLRAADDTPPAEWALTAAKGVIDLCHNDAPDAQVVAEHGEVWGWPAFIPYTEHPDGYEREAGGQSRRSYALGDQTAEVEVTVQSGVVTSTAPARIHYFRCDVASDQPLQSDLTAYFTDLYGAPAAQGGGVTVWLTGAAKSAAIPPAPPPDAGPAAASTPDAAAASSPAASSPTPGAAAPASPPPPPPPPPPSDDAALAAVVAAGAGADGVRIELSHDQGRDRAKITEFREVPAS